jgi:hypothetical protein
LQKSFIVHTDASGTALGAILSQIDEDGMEYVCQYDSRLLKGAELHYGISEKECLGIVWAIRKFRPYLHGSKFKVVTDHSALKWLMTIKDPTGKLARWAIYLQNYDFEIVHRQGSKHLNVDFLSRPTQISQLCVHSVDPYADANLLNFLRMGMLPPEVTKEEEERITSLKEHFFLDENELYYKTKNAATPNLKVPKLEDRRKLVEQAHLLGHFQAKTTEDRLMSRFYWPTMKDDIKLVIENCLPCLRNKLVPVEEHGAKALPITGLFDRVGIDCVFGLPETEEGYKGILVLTEYLSKFPYAVPIKGKSAQEIATHLFNYISFFGPPKTLLSDQGKEFLNQVVDKLSSITGIERKVTSAYHPRTNGLTERFNRTLIESLCRHTDTDPLHWHEWLPYVLLAYRTRIQSSTGYSPFEMLFGKSANHFSSWGEKDDSSDEDALYKRAIEIRSLVEDTRTNALEKIKKAQTRQKSSQDKAHNISPPWPVGTQVFIKNPKFIGKLGRKFTGPYKIVGITPNQNYWLETPDGVKLSTSYPRSRLKKTTLQDTASESYEVEAILDHKIRNGQIHYFVKWKNYGMEDCTWEPESHFDTPECITDYWASKNGIVEDDNSFRGGDMLVSKESEVGLVCKPSSQRRTSTRSTRVQVSQLGLE